MSRQSNNCFKEVQGDSRDTVHLTQMVQLLKDLHDRVEKASIAIFQFFLRSLFPTLIRHKYNSKFHIFSMLIPLIQILKYFFK